MLCITVSKNSNNSYTSTPVVRTGVYPHMPIAEHRSPRSTNCLQHSPSPTTRRLLFTAHTVRGSPAKFVAPANDRRTCYHFFLIFGLGGLPLGQSSPKEETTYHSPGSTILQNFSPIAQTVYEICVTKFFSTFWPRGG